MAPWSMGHNAEYFTRMMAGLGESLGFDVDTPWRKLPPKARRQSWRAATSRCTCAIAIGYGRTRSYYADFEGVMASSCSGGWIRPSPSR